ncbi:MAG: protoporphyrinogen oxidase [Planctomycetota bacterium]|jgi:oxygen-dependent protoporphyrinogen oxidase
MRFKVVGGGIAGLTAAYRLGKDGHEVTLFEARDRLGGNIRSDRPDDFGGCLLEWGPNGFLDNEPATLRLIEELGLNDRVRRARAVAAKRYIWRAGKLRALPKSPLDFFFGDLLPAGARFRTLLAPFTKSTVETDETIYEFAARRLGRGVADVLVDAFVTGVFAGDPKRLSLKSCLPKIANAKGLPKGGPKGVLTSFDDGLQVLIDALAERVDVRLGTPAGLGREDYDHVVCTVPAPRAAELAEGRLAELLQKIPSAPVAVVPMAFDAAIDVEDAFGFLVPRGQDLRILGTLYDSSIFDGRAPDGLRLFRSMVGGSRDPGALDLSDDEIIGLTARDLRTVWGSAFREPVHARVIRHPLGIAQYEVGHAALLDEIDAARPEGLRLAGSSYRGVALNACVKEAVDWAP